MKAHEFARGLEVLARILRNAPDMELQDFLLGNPRARRAESANIPVALSTLVSLSEIDKSQWIEFVRANDIKIEIRARDATRDIVGKVLRYLESNPEAVKKVRVSAEKSKSGASTELQRALEFLLKS